MNHGPTALCARSKGCTRPECVARGHRYRKWQRAGLVSIDSGDDARAHIAKLLADGVTRNHIADRAGISRVLVTRILNGGRATRKTAAAILAVEPAMVLAVGTTRRLQALACAGHSLTVIADATGVSRDWVSRVRAGQPERVSAVFAADVARVFAEMVMVPGGSRRSVTHAARQGWAPALAWDDIDHDPGPVEGWDAFRGGIPPTDPHVEAEVLRLARLGFNDSEIAVRTWLSSQTVLRIRQRNKKEAAA